MLVPYQPKGTDTVPSMLTPGEFVVNRAATQANLPLLKAINNGAQGYSNGGIAYRSKGGPIQYFADGTTGGPVQALGSQFTDSLNSTTASLVQFGNVLKELTKSIGGDRSSQGGDGNGVNTSGIEAFTTKINLLLDRLNGLSQIPTSITLNANHKVEVVIGPETLQALGDIQPSIANLVRNETALAIARYDQAKFA
jgi:hypothetical protein